MNFLKISTLYYSYFSHLSTLTATVAPSFDLHKKKKKKKRFVP